MSFVIFKFSVTEHIVSSSQENKICNKIMADCQQVEDFCKYVQDSKSFNIPLHKAYRLKSLHLHPDKWKESWGVSKEEAGLKFQSFSDTFKSISEQKRNDDKESCERGRG